MTAQDDPEAPHDVLAAEEFVVPAPSPILQREPLQVPEDPEDPEGELPPHDVLAGEEFPIPAAPGLWPASEMTDSPERALPVVRSKRAAGGIAVLLMSLIAVARRRGRRPRS